MKYQWSRNSILYLKLPKYKWVQKIIFNPKDAEFSYSCSHYKPMKERLQEKKRILILAVCLSPLGLDASQNPKNLFLNLVLGLG